MAQTHVRSGQVVSVRPLGDRRSGSRTTAIIKAGQLEVVRIVLPAGKQLREHSAPGEITVQCIEGRIAVRTPDARLVLEAGDLIHLRRHEPHALEAIVDSSALLTCASPSRPDRQGGALTRAALRDQFRVWRAPFS